MSQCESVSIWQWAHYCNTFKKRMILQYKFHCMQANIESALHFKESMVLHIKLIKHILYNGKALLNTFC